MASEKILIAKWRAERCKGMSDAQLAAVEAENVGKPKLRARKWVEAIRLERLRRQEAN
jgi:hypothetical protein